MCKEGFNGLPLGHRDQGVLTVLHPISCYPTVYHRVLSYSVILPSAVILQYSIPQCFILQCYPTVSCYPTGYHSVLSYSVILPSAVILQYTTVCLLTHTHRPGGSHCAATHPHVSADLLPSMTLLTCCPACLC